MDAQRFFTVAVPSIIARNFEQFISQSGKIACKVKGVGSWTLDFGNADDPVKEGFDARSELKIWFTEQAFDAFLSGRLDAKVTCKEPLRGKK